MRRLTPHTHHASRHKLTDISVFGHQKCSRRNRIAAGLQGESQVGRVPPLENLGADLLGDKQAITGAGAGIRMSALGH